MEEILKKRIAVRSEGKNGRKMVVLAMTLQNLSEAPLVDELVAGMRGRKERRTCFSRALPRDGPENFEALI